jgi:hypothetical protein
LVLQWIRRGRRTLTVAGAAFAAVLVFAGQAQAHTPVLLDSTDVLPWKAPLVLDGTDPISLFGTLPQGGAVRSAQLRMQAGQALVVEYLIPDLAPENGLSTGHLPRMVIIAPDLAVTVLEPQTRNPDVNPGFLRLNAYSATAVSGTYSLVVSGAAPARFLVVTGIEGEPFDGIERGSRATREQIDEWFATPP